MSGERLAKRVLVIFLASLLWAIMVGGAAAVVAASSGGIREADSRTWGFTCVGPMLAVLLVIAVGGLLWGIAATLCDLRNLAEDEEADW